LKRRPPGNNSGTKKTEIGKEPWEQKGPEVGLTPGRRLRKVVYQPWVGGGEASTGLGQTKGRVSKSLGGRNRAFRGKRPKGGGPSGKRKILKMGKQCKRAAKQHESKGKGKKAGRRYARPNAKRKSRKRGKVIQKKEKERSRGEKDEKRKTRKIDERNMCWESKEKKGEAGLRKIGRKTWPRAFGSACQKHGQGGRDKKR